ncbi:hypothetical protein D3C81_645370 [compost metagenome]
MLTSLGILILCADGGGGQASWSVACFFNRGLKVCYRDDTGKMTHPRTLGRQIDIGLKHAGYLVQRLFYPADAGRAGHFLYRQLGSFLTHAISGVLNGVNRCLRVCRAAEGEIGAFGGQIDRSAIHAGYRLQRTFDTAYTRGAGHAFDRQAQSGDRGHRRGGVGFERNGSH